MSETAYSFILFVLVATATPGGATALATASGVQFGYRRSLPLMAGIAAGLASLAAISASGMAGLLQSLPTLEWSIRFVGSAYLLWLAIRIGCAGAPQGESRPAKPFGFSSGLVLLILNPKAWAMVLGAAASFTAVASNVPQLALIMAAGFAVAALISLSLWCLGGAALAKYLRTEFHWRMANILLGVLLALSIIPLW